jgi:hypothetical protein
MPAAFSAVSVLDVDKLGPVIPQSFMGLSHEWPQIEELAIQPQYTDVIKLLQSYGSGPLSLRVGGGSTDHQKTVPGPAVWNALSKIHQDTGMKYIIGLNFYDQDTTLAKNQMDAAKKGLPAQAIQSFEIGNEVRCKCCRHSRCDAGAVGTEPTGTHVCCTFACASAASPVSQP